MRSVSKANPLKLAVFFLIASIPFSQGLSVKTLVVISIALLIYYNRRILSPDFFKQSWDALFYLFVLLLGVATSEDRNAALRVLETSFSFLALPLIFSKIEGNKKTLTQFLQVLVFSVLMAGIVCVIYSFFRFVNGEPLSVFFFRSLTSLIDVQPTYFAYYLCFSLTITFYFLYYKETSVPNYILIVSAWILFAILMLTAGRTAYISILLVFAFFILKFLFEETKTWQKKSVFAMSILFLVTMLVINSYNMNVFGGDNEGTDYWERIDLWNAVLNANSNWFIGVGTGDYAQINDYYLTHGLQEAAADRLNAHNQFLQSFFSNGVLGLISVLLLIVRPIYLSVRRQHVLGTLIFFPFIVYGMTEVFLGRYQGVIFFVLLHQLFVNFYYASTPSFLVKNPTIQITEIK